MLHIVGDSKLLLAAISVAFIVKLLLLVSLIAQKSFFKKSHLLTCLMLFTIGAMISDSAWILTFAKNIFFNNLDLRFYIFWMRITWVFYIIGYQSLSVLIENAIDRTNRINTHQKIYIAISSALALFFIALAFYNFNLPNVLSRPHIEYKMMGITSFYLIFQLMLSSILLALIKIRKNKAQKLLKRELKYFIYFIILPIVALDLMQLYPVFLTRIEVIHSLVGISTIFTTLAILYCMKIIQIKLYCDNQL